MLPANKIEFEKNPIIIVFNDFCLSKFIQLIKEINNLTNFFYSIDKIKYK